MSVQEICKKLHEYYDSSTIDELQSIDAKNFFENICSKYQDLKLSAPNSNLTLIKLIQNKIEKRYPKSLHLGGPNQIVVLKSTKYGKNIYCFAEAHSAKTDCPPEHTTVPIEDFLPELVNTTPKFLDVFIESNFPTTKGEFTNPIQRNYFETDLDYMYRLNQIKNHPDNFVPLSSTLLGGRMMSLKLSFLTCLNKTTRAAEECRLARVHYTDARCDENVNYYDPVNKFMDDLSKFEKEIKQRDRIVVTNDFISKHNAVLDLLSDNSTAKNFLLGVYFNTKLQKELKKSYLSKEVMEFYQKFAMEQIDKVLEGGLVVEYFRRLKSSKKIDDKIELLSALSEVLPTIFINLTATIVDIYTLARIFKIVDKPKDEPSQPRNIILYFGRYHILKMKEFLTSIGFEIVYEDQSKQENCIFLSQKFLDLLYE